MIGDSYSETHNSVDIHDSFYALAATQLNCGTIENLSRRANSWDSIKQLLVGVRDRVDWQNDVIFIGIPPLERVTIFDDYQDTAYPVQNISVGTWQVNQYNETSHNGLITDSLPNTDKFFVIHSDRSWTETQTLRDIFLITQWLDRVGANYLVLNLSKGFMKDNYWGPSLAVLDYVKGHERCVVFEGSSYCDVNLDINIPVDFDQWGWYGHHGAAGNQRFFEVSIEPKLNTLFTC